METSAPVRAGRPPENPALTFQLSALLAPWRVLLPVAGHDAPVWDDLVDNFGKAVMFDLRPDIGGVLVGARQLRNIGRAGEEAGVEARRLPLHDSRDVIRAETPVIGAEFLAEATYMRRTREI